MFEQQANGGNMKDQLLKRLLTSSWQFSMPAVPGPKIPDQNFQLYAGGLQWWQREPILSWDDQPCAHNVTPKVWRGKQEQELQTTGETLCRIEALCQIAWAALRAKFQSEAFDRLVLKFLGLRYESKKQAGFLKLTLSNALGIHWFCATGQLWSSTQLGCTKILIKLKFQKFLFCACSLNTTVPRLLLERGIQI